MKKSSDLFLILFLIFLIFIIQRSIIDIPKIWAVPKSSESSQKELSQELWSGTYGESGREVARSIQQTADGGYIVAGHLAGDLWILKISQSGDIEWQRSYGGVNIDIAYSIQQTVDGGYIVAGFTSFSSFYSGGSTIWLFKISSIGDIEWRGAYRTNNDNCAYCIQQTLDEGYIVAGFTGYNFWWPPGSNWSDIWLLKLSSNGDIEWQRSYGNKLSGCAYSIQQTSDGGYIAAGHLVGNLWVSKLNQWGDIEWQRSYGGDEWDEAYSLQQTEDGGYIVAGSSDSFGYKSKEFWILKLNNDGDIEWQRIYGGDYDECAYSAQQTVDGGYIVAGYTESFGFGGKELLILKLNEEGNIEWQRTYGGSFDECAYSVKQTLDGGYVVAGSASSFGSGDDDFWILKLNEDGDIDERCGFTNISTVSFEDTNIVPVDTSIIPTVTNCTPTDNDILPQDTNVTANILCRCEEPSSFSCISPPDGGIHQLLDTNLDWTDSSGANSYDIYFGVDSPPPFITNLDSSNYDPGTLNYNTIYYWRVVAKNNCAETLGIEWSFSTQFLCSICISANTGGTTNPTPGTYAYGSGMQIELNAIPSVGHNFSHWIGDVPSGHENDNPITILIDRDKSIEANFVPYYTINIEADEGGTTNPSPGTHVYNTGTEVQITAIPESGYRFSSWTGDIPEGHENDNPLIIIIDSDKSIAANFVRQYALTISSDEGGTTDPMPQTYTYDSGTEVSVEALPESNYRFSNWTGYIPPGHENNNPVVIIMDSDKSAEAHFIRQYSMTLSSETGGTTDPAPGTFRYDTGTEVTITAVPDTDYRFSGWSGDVPSGLENDNPLSIILDSDKSITANFLRQYSLTINAGTGGTTDPSPGSYIHDTGASISVKAVPNSGYQFSSWSGDASGTNNPITFTMDSNKSITANFSPIDTGGDSEGSVDSGDEGDGGGCFVATAAYGSPIHPYVEVLRNFRDRYLMTNRLGREFVDLYYKYSPSLSEIITEHRILKITIQIKLMPLVILSYFMIHFGPVFTIGMLMLIILLPIRLVRSQPKYRLRYRLY